MSWSAKVRTGLLSTINKIFPAVDRAVELTNQTSSEGVLIGTLLNAPAVGNPTFWLRVKINGTDYSIPCWPG